MTSQDRITIDLFPPFSWDEAGILFALEVQEAADGAEGWGFNDDELRFLAQAVAYYMGKDPDERAGLFEIYTEIDPEDPDQDGRFLIQMTSPPHLEPSASLRWLYSQ